MKNRDVMDYAKERTCISVDRSFVLVVIIALMVGLWYLHPRPFIASDPGAYANLAYGLSYDSNFTLERNHIFDHRIGVFFPTAFFYKIFGVNPTTSHIWLLFSSILTVLLIWFVTPVGNSRVFAALFWALSPFQYQFTVSLYPDIIVAAFMFASVSVLYFRYKFPSNILKQSLWGMLGVTMFFIALLAKESAYWILPFWVMVFARDVIKGNFKRTLPFYLSGLIFGLMLLVGYLEMCRFVWGDPFARLTAIKQLDGLHLWSLKNRTTASLIRRLTSDPLVLLLTVSIPVFALSVACFVKSFSSNFFWKGYFIVVTLMFWFGTTSFSFYEPITIEAPRMALPLLPPMCVLAGIFLANFSLSLNNFGFNRSTLEQFTAVFLILIVMFTKSLFGKTSTISLGTILICVSCLLLFSLSSFLKIKRFQMLQLAAVIGLAAAHILFIEKPEKNAVAEQKAITQLKNEIKSLDGATLILSADRRSPGVMNYYWGYNIPDTITIMEFDSNYLEENHNRFNNIALYINKVRSRFLKKAYKAQTHEEEMLKYMTNLKINNPNINKSDIAIYWFKQEQ